MFIIYKSIKNKYYFILKAGNNQNIITSEMFQKKEECCDAIELTIQNSMDDNNYERRIAPNGSYYFKIRIVNGKVIGTSEKYANNINCENGIDAVKKYAPISSTIDASTIPRHKKTPIATR